MIEIWKNVVGYEGLYEVSNLGHLRRCEYRTVDGKNLKQRAFTGIRPRLVRGQEKHVYRLWNLVAEAFVPNPNHKKEVIHLDGNYKNNRADNLIWGDRGDSIKWREAQELRIANREKGAGNARKKVLQLDFDNRQVAIHNSVREAAISVGKKNGAGDITRCCQGKLKQAYGFRWVYFYERLHRCENCGVTGSYMWHKEGRYCHACWQRFYKRGEWELSQYQKSGATKHPLYSVWRNMKTRCYNPKNRSYPNWGGRGVKVCDRWLEKPNGFWNFVEDIGKLGERPEGWSLDRIDVDGDYCLENVRWASPTLQANNRQTKGKTRGISVQDGRGYIDYQGKREYSPRGLSLEDAVKWRANKEKEYDLDEELGEYPVEEVIQELKAQIKIEKQAHISDNQDEYHKRIRVC